MNKYKMTIAYDGTAYGGWQVQHNTIAIQALIQNALETVLRMKTPLIGSGRTDAGVHALGQVAHFTHPHAIDPSKLLLSLNALLPPDIRILKVEEALPRFHARFSAVSKVYHYYVHLDPTFDPFQRRYAYKPGCRIDLDLLTQAASYFIGTHDFTSFANTRSGVSKSGNVRTIHRLDILKQEPIAFTPKSGICLAFEGNGFLYKMVRNIVGTLLDVCAQRIALEDIPRIFAKKDRRAARVAAPSHALFLMQVNYNIVE